MSKKLAAVLFALCLVLSGCVLRSVGGEGSGAVVYRLSTASGGGRLVRENIKVNEGDVLTERIVEALNGQPEDIHLLRVFPEGLYIVDISLEKGLATVEMSPEYASLGDGEKLLADAATVLSLSTVDEVCYVNIVCDGEIQGRNLRVENYAEADGLCGGYERTMKLYLPDEESAGLVPISLDITDDSSLDTESRILTELFKVLGNGMENTAVVSVSQSEGNCRVNLSEEFYGAEPADSYQGMLLIYSIVNSLCRVPGVECVTISVEGVDVASYGGFSTPWPMEANLSLVR